MPLSLSMGAPRCLSARVRVCMLLSVPTLGNICSILGRSASLPTSQIARTRGMDPDASPSFNDDAHMRPAEAGASATHPV